jgi:hypothetical protein
MSGYYVYKMGVWPPAAPGNIAQKSGKKKMYDLWPASDRDFGIGTVQPWR